MNICSYWEILKANITSMFLDIIHRPVYFSKHNVTETGFSRRLQVKPTQLGQIDREYGVRSAFSILSRPSDQVGWAQVYFSESNAGEPKVNSSSPCNTKFWNVLCFVILMFL
jgi:hypothetical protein